MRPLPVLLRVVLLLTVLGSLAGCLEVEQDPLWQAGHYDGKPDPLPDQTHFYGDRMLWMATIINRNHLQDDYIRMGP